ncbi:DUF192 domain-containing protein [Uliginosibacterium sp. 31-16]|uniref:DUF192 domain-containing protein n=1 Tax=Uliginosibacterium sp. 31-16 TaxID=3068315 RepID=UPI00273F91F0|nr:DUF192 domain-containing protein [Uliginosibacterium sp. 31-16]MDP5238357.1 DUF192 domain-containing protein [Uliginosibacterium sp. 31-16]
MNVRFALAALLSTVSLSIGAQAPKTVDLSIGMYRIQAEVAATQAQRELGLMNRKSMPQQNGMLFVFEQSQPYCFWMKNTLLPLSIAFIDEAGQIVNLADMQPQTETNHCATKPIRYALEMNQGWFSAKGIKAGTTVKGIAGPAER